MKNNMSYYKDKTDIEFTQERTLSERVNRWIAIGTFIGMIIGGIWGGIKFFLTEYPKAYPSVKELGADWPGVPSSSNDKTLLINEEIPNLKKTLQEQLRLLQQREAELQKVLLETYDKAGRQILEVNLHSVRIQIENTMGEIASL